MDFSKETVEELRKIAKKNECSGYSRLRKEELVNMLKKGCFKKQSKSSKRSKEKNCKSTQILNPESNRCVSITGTIGKKILKNGKSPSKSSKRSKEKNCKPTQILNPESNRCVSITGTIGKKILNKGKSPIKKKSSFSLFINIIHISKNNSTLVINVPKDINFKELKKILNNKYPVLSNEYLYIHDDLDKMTDDHDIVYNFTKSLDNRPYRVGINIIVKYKKTNIQDKIPCQKVLCDAFLNYGVSKGYRPTVKNYRKWALKNHPDKGGNTDIFSETNDCWTRFKDNLTDLQVC
jgi:hypothetical protein